MSLLFPVRVLNITEGNKTNERLKTMLEISQRMHIGFVLANKEKTINKFRISGILNALLASCISLPVEHLSDSTTPR